MSYKVLASDNIVYGPVDMDTLIQWAADERVLVETWIMRVLDNAWIPAGYLSELRPHFTRIAAQPRPLAIVHATDEVQVEELRQFALFAGVSNEQLTRFLDFAEFLFCEPGRVLIKKGDPGDSVFFVLSGSVRARIMLGYEEKMLTTINSGTFFGELPMLTQSIRSADIVVVEPSRLLRVSAQAFLMMSEEAPALACPILFAMSRSLASRIGELTLQWSRERATEHIWS